MSPAQRLAEWLDVDSYRQVDIGVESLFGRWVCDLRDALKVVLKSASSRDEAITAALDAWQKGGG